MPLHDMNGERSIHLDLAHHYSIIYDPIICRDIKGNSIPVDRSQRRFPSKLHQLHLHSLMKSQAAI